MLFAGCHLFAEVDTDEEKRQCKHMWGVTGGSNILQVRENEKLLL